MTTTTTAIKATNAYSNPAGIGAGDCVGDEVGDEIMVAEGSVDGVGDDDDVGFSLWTSKE